MCRVCYFFFIILKIDRFLVHLGVIARNNFFNHRPMIFWPPVNIFLNTRFNFMQTWKCGKNSLLSQTKQSNFCFKEVSTILSIVFACKSFDLGSSWLVNYVQEDFLCLNCLSCMPFQIPAGNTQHFFFSICSSFFRSAYPLFLDSFSWISFHRLTEVFI